ncbi:MAG: hypothetical protein U9R72_14555 [Chloroflexota bacterium]|nr:hypothetical protein [Chloroflexota bacterium]
MKSKSIYRWLTLLIGLSLLTASLAGCGPAAEPEVEEPAEEGAVEEPAEEGAVEEPAEE